MGLWYFRLKHWLWCCQSHGLELNWKLKELFIYVKWFACDTVLSLDWKLKHTFFKNITLCIRIPSCSNLSVSRMWVCRRWEKVARVCHDLINAAFISLWQLDGRKTKETLSKHETRLLLAPPSLLRTPSPLPCFQIQWTYILFWALRAKRLLRFVSQSF